MPGCLVRLQGTEMKVTVDGLSCSFGNFVALHEASFVVPSGSITALLGPSGCGKTTILRSIAGLIKPQMGRITFDDEVVFSDKEGIFVAPERRNLSLIFQDFALWPHMKVFDNVAFGLKLRRLPRDEIRDRVGEALDIVHLGHQGDRYPNQLSGGQQQRVAVARAIVTAPKLLLLDEPLSGLDTNLREEMRQELLNVITRLGMTAIHVTHDHIEALSMASQVVVLNLGQIEQAGDPVEVYARPASLFVASFLGSVNVLAGKVCQVSGTVATIEGDGWQLSGEASQSLNGTAQALIRPSSITLHRPNAITEANQIACEVTKAYFHGDRWLYQARLASGVTLKVIGLGGFCAGDEVRACFPVEACQVIPGAAEVVAARADQDATSG